MSSSSTNVKISPCIILSFLTVSMVHSIPITTNDICCFTYNSLANAMILQNSSQETAYYMSTPDCVSQRTKSKYTCSSFINYHLHKNNIMEFKIELEQLRSWNCDMEGVCEKTYPYNNEKGDIFKVYRIFYKNMDNINQYVSNINSVVNFLYH